MNNKKNLSSKEIYDLQKKKKTANKLKPSNKANINYKKIIKYFVSIGIIVGLIYGFIWFISSIPVLPPISSQNHSEESPDGYISITKIPDPVQRHMLDHSEGNGVPGVIVQYNCNKYNCEPDLIQKLTTLVEKYPDNVYLAPNNYDGKIILTRQGEMKIMDKFDEQEMKNFIENI